MTRTSSPSRAIARRFDALTAAKRKALVVYITAGHPDSARSLALLQGLEDAGADVIELGIPFSDPLADGPVIQASSQRALELGMTFAKSLEMVERARVAVPIVLFSYLNPVMAAGASALDRAADAGAAGILITDLPVGSDPEREEWLASGPLEFVRLVAPTTPRERMAEIARHGSGFVYLISRLGVTGEHAAASADLPQTVDRLRSVTSLPICVGFGISKPEQAVAISRIADGVVVGSAVVRAADSGVDEALRLVRSLRQALDADSA